MTMMIDGELMTNTSSSTSRNSDLIRPLKSSNSSSSSTSTNPNRNHNHNHNHHFLSAAMTVDDAQPQSQPLRTSSQINFLDTATASSLTRQQSGRASSKIADDVWKEIVAGGRSCKQEVADEMMTLEDFLAKAEAVEEEDVKVVARLPSGGGSGVGLFSYDQSLNMNMKVDAFGMEAEEIGGGGRGKRRAMLETLDKAAQQRQRRMIKNRESAARSRERKQAYQAELESLAVKLEEENEMLLKVKTEQTRKRYKQLLDNIIPVTEKQRPRKYVMTRARSMEW